jgi:diadenosine tetraphosphatase ApaH/serine/threonine PP2A family protein phosphatase
MVGEDSFMLAHGSPRHPIWEYLFSVSTARANFDHFSNHVCFVGHTHIQSIFVQDGKKYGAFEPLPEARLTLDNEMRFIINPGSVGQPRDGNPDASYAILDTEQNTIEFRRLPYPIEVTQERMREHHLPSRLIERLNYGI